MKKLLFVALFVVMSTLGYSQSEKENLLYVPMRTYNFNRQPNFINTLHNTEGGNIGLIWIRRKREGRFYSETHLGAVRNSYGNLSVIGNIG
jgi:hypothetical protein